LALCAAILFFGVSASAQQSLGTLRGNVRDELGGVIIGATVTAADAAGAVASTPAATARPVRIVRGDMGRSLPISCAIQPGSTIVRA
jgi:hypothetical protein